MNKPIVFEGEASIIRDWLAGGQFYQVEVDGTDLLSAIEVAILGMTGNYDEGQIQDRTPLGKVRLTIEVLR